MVMPLSLNPRALRLTEALVQDADVHRVTVSRTPHGARLVDAGCTAPGGLEAGRFLARICLADLASVSLAPGSLAGCPLVQVATDFPVEACLASQYAGWQISVGQYFAMGSGPMRAAAGREPLFQDIGHTEAASQVVGILEASTLPGEEIVDEIARKCKVPPDQVTLLVAATTSIAGSYQVVARSVETCLHKLHELKFDVKQVVSGFGTAPLPPIAKKTVPAIGRTNDAILYGAQVTLWVRSEDEVLSELGPRVPASASPDYGAPFAEVFQRVGGDFYKIDPLLFSPAQVTLHNLATGRSFSFGEIDETMLRRSFGV
jgi:methenyltetrahydromethanopterin cyclohydrolase